MNEQIISSVSEYYTNKILEHGATPQGVDWNSHESQYIRFEQLSKVIDLDKSFTINDVGCGYGEYFKFLSDNFSNFKYYGNDISEEMIKEAIYNQSNVHPEFTLSEKPKQICDYCVSSGIFSVKRDFDDEAWGKYVSDILGIMDTYSKKGFAFNLLTSYSDADKRRGDLYYADPCAVFDYCKRNFSRQVALLHDYKLWEFTIIVRKEL